MKKLSLVLLSYVIAIAAFAQKPVLKLNLGKLYQQKKIIAFNREISVINITEEVLKMDERAEAGFAWLTDQKFVNGTIEFDVKGKDVLQQSFVGVAFHAENEKAYDCIYFRPFNFRADDPIRRSHGVQYISVPDYDWPILREKFPNKYEQAVEPAPDPNNWIHARIVVSGKSIKVYVNNREQQSLSVEQIVPLKGNKIGLWVGNGSGGEWKNVIITSSK